MESDYTARSRDDWRDSEARRAFSYLLLNSFVA